MRVHFTLPIFCKVGGAAGNRQAMLFQIPTWLFPLLAFWWLKIGKWDRPLIHFPKLLIKGTCASRFLTIQLLSLRKKTNIFTSN